MLRVVMVASTQGRVVVMVMVVSGGRGRRRRRRVSQRRRHSGGLDGDDASVHDLAVHLHHHLVPLGGVV